MLKVNRKTQVVKRKSMSKKEVSTRVVADCVAASKPRKPQKMKEAEPGSKEEPWHLPRINWGVVDPTKKRKKTDAVEPEEAKETVYIYSSSHMSDSRGLKGKLYKLLNNEFKLKIEAQGGRQWDSWAQYTYKAAQFKGESAQKLHLILLGDNDVRQAVRSSEIEKSNLLAAVEYFGITVVKERKYPEFKNDTVFVNGLIPFPICDLSNTPQLVKTFYDYTEVMSSLTKLDPSIHFVPMKEKAIQFCMENEIDLKSLFLKDGVHLSDHGENFLAGHLATQIKAFRAAKRLNMTQKDFEFYQDIVNLWEKDETVRHFKLAKETNFFEKEFATLSLACSEKETEKLDSTPDAKGR